VRAAQLGRSVVVVDRGGPDGGLGGACLHVGCIPSKALIELAEAARRTTAMAPAGLQVDGVSVDLGAFQRWKGGIVQELSDGVGQLLKSHGIRHVEGGLRFIRTDRAAVALLDGSSLFLEFKQAILAPGSRPAELASLPLDGERVIDSTGALALDRLPASVAVVGGGYVGLELGTALAKLGARVSIVEALDRVLTSMPESLARSVSKGLRALGIEVYLSSMAIGLDGDQLVIDGPDGELRLAAEKVIVAVGRKPNTDDLGLAAAGIEVDADGLVPVDERRRATANVAAIGDITAGPALAHKASAEGIVAAESLCGLPAAFDPMTIPVVAFTDPEVASAGLTLRDAEAQGMDAVEGSFPASANGRALTLGARNGFTTVVVDRQTDRVVGVQVAGAHASELIAEGALAIETISSPIDVLGTIHPHPTMSEGMHNALERFRSTSASSDGLG
jgi:dihydrolipoamide dehydrogenase